MGEQRFREILDAAPDAILQVDQGGLIILLNRATENMFGYNRADLLGKPVEVLIPQDVRERHHGHRVGYHNKASVRPMGVGLTLQGLRQDGTRFPVEISLSPSESPEVGFTTTAIIRDIHRPRSGSSPVPRPQRPRRTNVQDHARCLPRPNCPEEGISN